MDVDDILRDFSRPRRLPRRAIEAAKAQRDAVIPVFLDCLTESAESDDRSCEHDGALFCVTHLLAEFREQRAFAPLMKLLAEDGERVEAIFGDLVTDGLAQLVISVFDGQVDLIYEVIRNPEADDYVRDALFHVLAALAIREQIDRRELERFLIHCYASLEPQQESIIWIGWYTAIAVVGLVQCHGLVRKAYAKGFIAHWYAKWHHVQDDLRELTGDEDRNAWLERERLYHLEDSLAALSEWTFGASRDLVEPMATRMLAVPPQVNPFRDVGRNDPCPCGSGRKFKKCCLQEQAA